MGLIAWNYDDWKTFLGDFTKFGLAILTIIYDLIFIVQHYCLYKKEDGSYKQLNDDPNEADDRAPLVPESA